ncbi:MAG TPA: hypothetical protein VFE52_07350, partial [Devosia sp.]|nr:hypothetical protein [Devosia sp.]
MERRRENLVSPGRFLLMALIRGRECVLSGAREKPLSDLCLAGRIHPEHAEVIGEELQFLKGE